jgi:hypothetical protein
MMIAVVSTGATSSVLRRTVATRDWEAYTSNAAEIGSTLEVLGHEVIRLTDGRVLVDALSATRPIWCGPAAAEFRATIPATHLPGLLEMLGVSYVGSRRLPAGWPQLPAGPDQPFRRPTDAPRGRRHTRLPR